MLRATCVAPNNIGLDSERFLAFIPLSPSVAARVDGHHRVGTANFSAESWLEGAGAVAAENQVIELLCRAAGMPAGAAGCFMSGGSHRQPLGARCRPRTCRRATSGGRCRHGARLGRQRVAPARPASRWSCPTGPDCRLTGDALRAAIGDRTRRRHRGGGRRLDQRRRRSTTSPACADVAARSRRVVPRRRRLRARGDAAAGAARTVRRHRACRLVHRRPAQVAVRHRRFVRARVPPTRPRSAGAHPARTVHRRAAHRRRRVQPLRSRLSAHPPGQRSADLVRARAARRRGAPHRDPSRHHVGQRRWPRQSRRTRRPS